MKINRKRAIIAAISISAFMLCIFALKLYFVLSFSENDLRTIVVSFCKNNLGKSAKLDEIRINFTGNIVITNFNLSMNSDFNDNISLIKAEETIFNLSFFRLLRGTAEVNSIIFNRAKISLHKSYGKSYSEVFKNIVDLPANLNDLKNLDMDDLTLKIYDSTLFYHEFFTEEKLDMECRNFTASFKKRKDRIKYSLSGDTIQYKTKGIQEGGIKAKGVFILSQNRESHHKIGIDNIDLSIFNNHVAEYSGKEMFLTGGFSTNMKIDCSDSEYTYHGNLKTANLNIISTGSDQFEMVSNGNFNADLNIRYSVKNERLEISKLHFYDDNMDIRLNGKKSITPAENIFALRIGCELMDFDELSGYITPARDFSYRGKTSFFADIYIDFNNDANNYLAIEGSLKNFGISVSGNGVKNDIISGCSGQVSVKDRKAHITSAFQTGGSDFTFDLQSSIENYLPLKSSSSLKIKSKKTQLPLAFDLLNRGLSLIFDSAYDDEKNGYDDIFFLKKPGSVIVNNNDITLAYHADTLAFNDRAGIKNFNMKASLLKGALNVDSFTAEGYDGAYTLQMQCFLNRDYPTVSIKGGVKDFDLGKLSDDMKAAYTFSGKMNIDFDYELSAYRMLQVLQNSRGNLNISLSNAVISNSPIQKDFAAYLEKHGAIKAALSPMNITSLNIGLSQMGESFAFRNFSCSGDPLSLSGYGSYNYQSGLNVPVSAVIRDKDGKTQNAQLSLTGRLIDPAIQLKIKNAGAYSLFSDIK